MRTHHPAVHRCVVSIVVATAFACSASDTFTGTPGQITTVRAYLCGVRGLDQCAVRGAAIPTGQLPPSNEAFQVWAWHSGTNTTVWRVIWPAYGDSPADSGFVEKIDYDSVYTWVNFNGAPAKTYTVRVLIRGPNGFLSEDSLRWQYP